MERKRTKRKQNRKQREHNKYTKDKDRLRLDTHKER
jgi:hypothetical protein